MKMRAPSVMLCVCFALGATVGCSPEHPDFCSNHVWTEYKYDDGDKLLEICEYSDDEEYIRRTEFEYDA